MATPRNINNVYEMPTIKGQVAHPITGRRQGRDPKQLTNIRQ